MLNPRDVANALAATLKLIPDLVALIPAQNIIVHEYLFGVEVSLQRAVYAMESPSILIAYQGVRGGNFDAMTIWKHPLELYIRSQSQVGATTPSDPGTVWHTICEGTVTGSAFPPLSIRKINILPNLSLMDTPSFSRKVDEDGQDYWCAEIVLPEMGDDPET